MAHYIDCHGYFPDDERYLNDPLCKPAEWVEVGTSTYMRFTRESPCPITKVDTATGTMLWAYGDWATKETLTYETPLKEPIFLED